jgi:hypothetical protein
MPTIPVFGAPASSFTTPLNLIQRGTLIPVLLTVFCVSPKELRASNSVATIKADRKVRRPCVFMLILLFGRVLNRASGASIFSLSPPKREADGLYWLMLQTYVLPCLTRAVHNGPRLVFALGTLIMALGPAAC